MADISTYKELGKYNCTLRLGPYVRPKPFDKAKWNSTLQIILPLPLELRDDTRTDFNVTNMETVGDILNADTAGVGAAGLRNAGEVAHGVKNILTNTMRGTRNQFMVGGATILDGAGKNLVPPDRITSALQQTLGKAPNPNQAVSLVGPVLREFNFSWMFYPYTEQETANIKNMIDQLKRRSLPSAAFSSGAAILNYPELCQINFYPWDKGAKSDNNYGWSDASIIRIKRCFISAVNVSYTPGGPPAFFAESQMPVAIQMNLALKEAEYMLSEDYGATKSTTSMTEGLLNSATGKAGELLGGAASIGSEVFGSVL